MRANLEELSAEDEVQDEPASSTDWERPERKEENSSLSLLTEKGWRQQSLVSHAVEKSRSRFGCLEGFGDSNQLNTIHMLMTPKCKTQVQFFPTPPSRAPGCIWNVCKASQAEHVQQRAPGSLPYTCSPCRLP